MLTAIATKALHRAAELLKWMLGEMASVIVNIALIVASTNAGAATWVIAVKNTFMRALYIKRCVIKLTVIMHQLIAWCRCLVGF